MLLALDVDYRERGAMAAGVLFHAWGDASPARQIVVPIAEVAEYMPGEFYRRELPCLEAVVAAACVALEAVVIDGYVWLDVAGCWGLGAYLHASLGGPPVIGVAKTAFSGAFAQQIRRGESRRPLYVTSAGMEAKAAAELIRGMHGDSRIPTLLQRVDQLCRGR